MQIHCIIKKQSSIRHSHSFNAICFFYVCRLAALDLLLKKKKRKINVYCTTRCTWNCVEGCQGVFPDKKESVGIE